MSLSVSLTRLLLDADVIGVSSPNYAMTSYTPLPQFNQSPQNRANANYKPVLSQSIIFPDLNLLSLDELNFLKENSDRQNEFIDNLPPMKELDKTLDDMITQIDELTDTNIAQGAKLSSLNVERAARIEKIQKLLSNNEVLNQNYQLLSDRYLPANIKVSTVSRSTY